MPRLHIDSSDGHFSYREVEWGAYPVHSETLARWRSVNEAYMKVQQEMLDLMNALYLAREAYNEKREKPEHFHVLLAAGYVDESGIRTEKGATNGLESRSPWRP